MSTIFIPKGRNTFYLSFFEDGKRKTRNIKIPKNKKKEALKFKKEFDSIMYLKNQSSPVYLESNVLNLDEGILK